MSYGSMGPCSIAARAGSPASAAILANMALLAIFDILALLPALYAMRRPNASTAIVPLLVASAQSLPNKEVRTHHA
jgi:hypothetical protein